MPKLPVLAELYRYGLVSTICVSVGFLFVSIGAFGDISFGNRKLMLGATLISFGIMWHFGGRMTDTYEDDDGKKRRSFEWNDVGTWALFFLMFLLFGYVFAMGRLPIDV